jgi:hypothetical protein
MGVFGVREGKKAFLGTTGYTKNFVIPAAEFTPSSLVLQSLGEGG